MDVRCERCGTEYEFDDALVSDRGTSVKCTECGNEFRVLPVGGLTEKGRPDAWHVQRVDGSEVTYTSLRDLQRGIRSRDVQKDDRLRREGQATSRPLGSIPELEELLRGTWVDSTRAPILKSTVDTLRPQPGQPSHVERIPAARIATTPARRDTLRPQGAPVPPVPLAPVIATAGGGLTTPGGGIPPAPESDPATLERFNVGDLPRSSDLMPSPIGDDPIETSSPLPPLTRIDERASIPDDDGSNQDGHDSGMGARISFNPPSLRRRRVGGWIVSLVLLGGVAVLGLAVARPYLIAKRERSNAPLDSRAADLLSAADRAYAAGNLDLAKEDVDKASALAEHDPGVLHGRAKVADARADVPWLRLRLLPQDATDEIRATEANARELASTAESLAIAATNAAPTDPASVRAHIDSLRLAGKTAEARSRVTQLAARADHADHGQASSDPETAYVLAALDAAEPLPPWRTVIERLRTSASAEGELGRARSLLVYALARSGDTTSAKTELDRMSLFSRPHPLTPLLRAFVQKQPSVTDGGAMTSPSGGSLTAIDVNSLPRSASPGGSGGSGGGDSRVLDAQGDSAREKGDYVKAAALYSQSLERSPNDSEALGGLGDVARARGDFDSAKASYRRALLANPQYLPAMIGLADVEHDSGDKAAAQQTYKDITERFPDSAYPARVKQRAEGGEPKSASKDAGSSPSPTSASTATTPAGPGASSAPSIEEEAAP